MALTHVYIKNCVCRQQTGRKNVCQCLRVCHVISNAHVPFSQIYFSMNVSFRAGRIPDFGLSIEELPIEFHFCLLNSRHKSEGGKHMPLDTVKSVFELLPITSLHFNLIFRWHERNPR